MGKRIVKTITNNIKTITNDIKTITNDIKPGDYILEPNSLEFIVNHRTTNICLTKLYFEDNIFKNTSQNCITKSIGELTKLLSIPSIIINYDYILEIYNIESIKDLVLFIDNAINANNTFNFINRCINAWIRKNFNDLKVSYKFLIKINYTIFNFFFKYLIISKKKFYKDVNKYIPYWIENNNIDNFNFNLALEIKKYLDKKYEQK